MISSKSAKAFLYINSILIGLGYLVSKYNYFYISYLLRNYLLLLFLYQLIKNKKTIKKENGKRLKIIDHLHVLSSTFIESITYISVEEKPICNWVYFIPMLFIFELIFDLFHYTFHRLLHTRKLYFIHKHHHHYNNPSIINTYYQNPFDLFISGSVPTILALIVLPVKFTKFQLETILVYKSYIEISGHAGKQCAPVSCFPACIWLPKALGIELYTEDHHRHHSENNCNYSKRFALWDKVFKTYTAW